MRGMPGPIIVLCLEAVLFSVSLIFCLWTQSGRGSSGGGLCDWKRFGGDEEMAEFQYIGLSR